MEPQILLLMQKRTLIKIVVNVNRFYKIVGLQISMICVDGQFETGHVRVVLVEFKVTINPM